MNQLIGQEIPEALLKFTREACGAPTQAFHWLAPEEVAPPARGLLVHQQDMTSTLAAFHASALRVEVLQQQRIDDLYLREVFLRTCSAGKIVEYGVIAIALEQFDGGQQRAIQAGEIPLGALLHRFAIPFVSSPIAYFSVSTREFAATRLATLSAGTCFGRFNRLARSSGEPFAWIMEILPPAE